MIPPIYHTDSCNGMPSYHRDDRPIIDLPKESNT